MVILIGITAGEIWRYLDEHESATIAQLATGLRKPKELVIMSLGWLAREGYVNLGDEDSPSEIRLNAVSKT